MNVLSNANKFTTHGQIKIYCRLSDDIDGRLLRHDDPYKYLYVEVTDQGLGIAKDD